MLISYTPDEVTMMIYVLERAESAVTSATLLQHRAYLRALREKTTRAYRKVFVPMTSVAIDST